MAKFLIWVNTYNRKDMLCRLIENIRIEQRKHTVDIFVVNDYSEEDYSEVKSSVQYYWETNKNYGKEEYYKLITFGLNKIKTLQSYDYYIKTDDDMCLACGFFHIVERLVAEINDPNWATIDILSAKRQRGKTLLGHPVEIQGERDKYYRTQWVDMNFIFNLKALPYTILNCKAGKASSGVGLWLTRYLTKKPYNLYQSATSLVIHGDHPSKMNVEERKKNPLITRSEL